MAADLKVGDQVPFDALSEWEFVDAQATSKGKGFSGAMKAHNFAGQSFTRYLFHIESLVPLVSVKICRIKGKRWRKDLVALLRVFVFRSCVCYLKIKQ